MQLFKRQPNKAEAAPKNLQNPRILEVNLVKEDGIVAFDWNQHIFILAVVLAIAGALVAEIYFGLDWWSKQEALRTQEVEAKIAKVNSETNKLKTQFSAGLTYKEKSAAFSDLLANHIYWTNFFSWLEKNTLSSVKYNGFTGDLSGKYTLEATAKTYADVSWQVKALLNDPLTQKVEVLQATAGQGKDKTKASEVKFSLLLVVKPEIFKK